VHQLYYSALDPKTARFINGVEPVTDVKVRLESDNFREHILTDMIVGYYHQYESPDLFRDAYLIL
jgi:hypothetical protein